MASGDLTFRFIFPQNSDADMRTFQIRQVIEGSLDTAEIYKFHHPNTGTNMGVTTIQRKNAATQRWENAGQIEWSSDTNASVFFGGIERVSMRDLRKLKKPTSKSRRFKANGAEYKWKIAENGVDINCTTTSRGKQVANWSQATLILRVTERAEGILDRVVVTFFLNLWMKRLNMW